MKIYNIQKANSASPNINLDKFPAELRELSDRYGIKLISIGAMSTVASVGPAYLAVGANEADEINSCKD